MVNQVTNGFVCLRDYSSVKVRTMFECALWMSDILPGKRCAIAIGMAHSRFVSISRGSPPPEER